MNGPPAGAEEEYQSYGIHKVCEIDTQEEGTEQSDERSLNEKTTRNA